MKATRASQPYRADRPRQPSMALTAMLRGSTPGGMNPADTHRAAHHVMEAWRKRRQSGRPARPSRPSR